jgi:hypothetical protein
LKKGKDSANSWLLGGIRAPAYLLDKSPMAFFNLFALFVLSGYPQNIFPVVSKELCFDAGRPPCIRSKIFLSPIPFLAAFTGCSDEAIKIPIYVQVDKPLYGRL